MPDARRAAAWVGDLGKRGEQMEHPEYTANDRAWHYIGSALVCRVGNGHQAHGRWIEGERTLCGRMPTLVLAIDYNPMTLLLSGRSCIACEHVWRAVRRDAA